MLHYGLRDADRLECEAAGFDEGFALQESFKVTPDCRTVVYNNEPVGMFGVAPVPSSGVRVGLVWFLGTNGMSKITTRFLRESRQWLETISADYDLLTNIVHHGNTLHIRWLQWLGFVFLSRRAGPFIEFVRITDVQHPSDRVEIQRGHPE
ncbi:MAG: DUF2833 domain-containing protein [Flavobacteriales bacterium]|nr:DUF2833 domain-containing protein [Flavobacteriales bacterium]